MSDGTIKENLMNYTRDVSEKLMKTDFCICEKIAERQIDTHRHGGTVFTAGNGGSAATASHMANDFTKGCAVLGRTGFRIICLADSAPIITCLANDFSYEDILSIPLKTQGNAGDTLVVFSGSGNSPNVLKVVALAKEMGIFTIGFSGRDGGKLSELCDILLIAPTDSMEQIEDMHMMYEHGLSCAVQVALAEEWGIEIVKFPEPENQFEAAIFDFDGTVSLIREGWQDIMIPYFVEVIAHACSKGEIKGLQKAGGMSEEHDDILNCVRDFVDTLTGKQTIYQCIRLGEEVSARGGRAEEPIAYKKEYLRRLEERIAHRHEELQNGCNKEQYLVPGAVEMIRTLNENGVKTYLASGTDETDVLKEAKLLGISELFTGGVFGAKDEVAECTKSLVIRRIIKENSINPNQLVSFGDGYVEIEIVKDMGGYSVGAATDEASGKGINDWKRKRLLAAGAHAIIPNFSDWSRLATFLNIH